MSIEMIVTILAMIPAVLVGFIIYVWALLYVSRLFNGLTKDIVAALIYGAFAVLVVTPLYYLIISINQPALMEGDNTLLAIVLGSYFVVVAPGFYYLFSKIGALRNAGYFTPRR